MNLIASIFEPITQALSSNFRDPADWLTEALTLGKTASGISVNPEKALTLSTYFACMRVVGEDTAKLPFQTFARLSDRGRDLFPEHRTYDLLEVEANPECTAFDFRESTTGYALGWGNGLAHIERNNAGDPLALWPIHPSRGQVDRIAGKLVYKIRDDEGRDHVFDPMDILHIKGPGSSTWGYSVAKLAAESLGIALAAERYGGAVFGNSAAIGVVFEHPKTMTEPARDRFLASVKKIYAGPTGAPHSPYVVEEGMKLSKASITNEEAQFLETRQFQVEEVCRFFRVNPNKIGDRTRAQGWSTLESLQTEHVESCLMPWFRRWETEVNRKLFTPEERRRIFAEHNANALLRGDVKTRGEFYGKLFAYGALSPNEIRRLENQNPRSDPGGDAYYVQGGYARSDQPEPRPGVAPAGAAGVEGLSQPFARLFQDAIARALRKERLAAKRVITNDATARTAWADRFYPRHREYVVGLVLPVAESFAELVSSVKTPTVAAAVAEVVLREVEAFAAEYVAESRRELTNGNTPATMAGLLDEWLTSRPLPAAAVLMENLTAALELEDVK